MPLVWMLLGAMFVIGNRSEAKDSAGLTQSQGKLMVGRFCLLAGLLGAVAAAVMTFHPAY